MKERDKLRRKHDPPRGILGVRSLPPAREHARYWPCPELAPFVEHHWVVRWDLAAPETNETLPHPSVHMVFSSARAAATEPGERRAEIVGVMRRRFTVRLAGRGGVIGTKFRPGGFRPFVAGPVGALSDRRWPIAEVLGEGAGELAARVFASFTDEREAVAEVEAFLLARRPLADAAMELAARIVARIVDDRSITRVEQLVGDAGLTSRALQRLFREYVGTTPKSVIQRYRLIEAAERLRAGELVDGADLAGELGYADQAHFIRDFKAIVGRSPAAYARSLR